MNRKLTLAAWIAVGTLVDTVLPTAVFAQTPMTSNGIPVPPPPASVVKQAEDQANGQFTKLRRSTIGGQIQEAWDKAPSEAGVVAFKLCDSCVYRVRLRQHMVSNFELPIGETIKKIDNGDRDEFQIEQRGDRRFTIKPYGYGVDSNLLVYGVSGVIYPIYIRTESFNSVNIPDMIVRIEGSVLGKPKTVESLAVDGIGIDDKEDGHLGSGAASKTPDLPPSPDASVANAVAGLKASKPKEPGDFVQKVEFDPTKLYGWGEFELWGGGPHVNELKQSIETVFRDDYMIYIKFKGNFELPVGYVVVDQIDELVNTRLNGNTFIIEVEEDRKLFSLKSGETYLCIRYTGDKPS
jgi:ComB9 competence protein